MSIVKVLEGPGGGGRRGGAGVNEEVVLVVEAVVGLGLTGEVNVGGLLEQKMKVRGAHKLAEE